MVTINENSGKYMQNITLPGSWFCCCLQTWNVEVLL